MWPLVALCCWGGLSLPLSLALSAPQGRAAALASPALASPAPAPPLPDTTESKVEKLGRAFKRQVRRLRARSGRLELVFLVDESSSVGPANFLSELRFVKKLLSDFPVVPAATRVAIVTFSSRSNVVPRVDYISRRRPQQHKCALLGREIPAIAYRGGGTYTKGAFQQAAVSAGRRATGGCVRASWVRAVVWRRAGLWAPVLEGGGWRRGGGVALRAEVVCETGRPFVRGCIVRSFVWCVVPLVEAAVYEPVFGVCVVCEPLLWCGVCGGSGGVMIDSWSRWSWKGAQRSSSPTPLDKQGYLQLCQVLRDRSSLTLLSPSMRQPLDLWTICPSASPPLSSLCPV